MTSALLMAAVLAAAPAAPPAAAPTAAEAADSAVAAAERALGEARAAGASEPDLGAAAEALARARSARKAGQPEEARRLSDEAWTLARRAREAAAGRTRFSVGVGDDEATRVEVQRGRVEVEAQGERAAVPAGQAARVRRGSKPEVAPLPAAPALLEPNDGAAVTVRPSARQGEPVLAWSAVAGAVSYEVVLSRDEAFREVALRLASPAPRLHLRGELAPGDYRWRVTARDGRGFAGPASEPRRIKVVEKPPRLEVDTPTWK
ncbi:MAG TPA: hypothetical protein VFR85_11160 [Anaeromyxobacteraceae bacterium]|nr:hypothetical protein [Anaeromyxobacteraceae bacterium]